MTICTILASINNAHALADVHALTENALNTYAFDDAAITDIKHAAQAATYRLTHPYAVATNTMDVPTQGELVIEMEAICFNEPRGEFGLEGYQRGETYLCQFVRQPGRLPYYRVFPGEPADYYECAVPRHIIRFFTIEEKSS